MGGLQAYRGAYLCRCGVISATSAASAIAAAASAPERVQGADHGGAVNNEGGHFSIRASGEGGEARGCDRDLLRLRELLLDFFLCLSLDLLRERERLPMSLR